MNQNLFDISVSFNLQNSPNDVTITDNTPYVANGVALSLVVGKFKLQNPVGIFHDNTSYTTPDITRLSSDHFDHSLPLDGLNRVFTGDYTFQYKVQITDEPFSFSLVGISLPLNSFIISGNYVAQILNATGGILNIVGYSAVIGTYTIASATYDSVNNQTSVVVSEIIPSSNYGTDTMEWEATTEYTVTKLENFCYTEPEITLNVTHDCKYSQLISEDVSTYIADICGTQLSPIVISRVHTIKAPNGITPPVADVVSSVSKLTVNNIYTRTYNILMETTVTYLLSTGATLTMIVSAMEEHDVDCDDGLCCIYQCIANLYNKWLEYKGTDLREATRYQEKLIKIMGKWMLVSISSDCGKSDQDQQISDLIQLIKSDDCYCCGKTTDLPVQVIPLISGGNNDITTVSTCGNGITVTTNIVGNTTDYQVCLDTDLLVSYFTSTLENQSLGDHSDVNLSGEQDLQVLIYDSATSKWINYTFGIHDLHDVDTVTVSPSNGDVLKWNSTTAKWEPEAQGVNGLLLLNDVSDDSTTNAGLTTLKSFDIPANTLSSDGDYVEVEVWLSVTSLTGIKNFKALLNAASIAVGVMSPTSSPYTVGYWNIKITRLTSSTASAEWTYMCSNLWNTIAAPFVSFIALSSLDFTTANTLYIQGSTDTAGTPATCKLLRVKSNKL